MEKGVPGCLPDSVVVLEQKPREQEREHNGFDRQGHEHDPADQPLHVPGREGSRFDRRRHPRAHAESPRDEQSDERGEDHDPEATQLDEQHDHGEAEAAPMCGGVEDGESGHTHR